MKQGRMPENTRLILLTRLEIENQVILGMEDIHINLDKEMDIISSLGQEDWEAHFLKYMDDFYEDATEEERLNFIQFALKLCKADDVITAKENHYLNLLFDNWNIENKDA